MWRRAKLGNAATSSSSLSLSMGTSTWLADAVASDSVGGPVYEPIMPQAETLVGMGIIVVLCVITGWVWANVVVPTSRTKLAISKSRGGVKEYLDELKVSDPSLADKDALIVAATETEADRENPISSDMNNQDDRAFERWLFTDWLQDNKSARKAGRQKEPALPILKDAKWNSGDNPILVATALISLGVLFTAFTERVLS